MSSLLKILLIGFAVTLHLDTRAQTEAIPFVHEKVYVLPSGKKVAVNFKERACKSGECREVDGGVWGMDGGVPRFVTEVLLVSINGNKFVIPEKFYKDFTNTYQLNVFEKKRRIVIELKGGEGAGGYTARFMLGGMCGFEREVCGEMCNEIWERTTWHNSFAYEADPQCKSGIH